MSRRGSTAHSKKLYRSSITPVIVSNGVLGYISPSFHLCSLLLSLPSSTLGRLTRSVLADQEGTHLVSGAP